MSVNIVTHAQEVNLASLIEAMEADLEKGAKYSLSKAREYREGLHKLDDVGIKQINNWLQNEPKRIGYGALKGVIDKLADSNLPEGIGSKYKSLKTSLKGKKVGEFTEYDTDLIENNINHLISAETNPERKKLISDIFAKVTEYIEDLSNLYTIENLKNQNSELNKKIDREIYQKKSKSKKQEFVTEVSKFGDLAKSYYRVPLGNKIDQLDDKLFEDEKFTQKLSEFIQKNTKNARDTQEFLKPEFDIQKQAEKINAKIEKDKKQNTNKKEENLTSKIVKKITKPLKGLFHKSKRENDVSVADAVRAIADHTVSQNINLEELANEIISSSILSSEKSSRTIDGGSKEALDAIAKMIGMLKKLPQEDLQKINASKGLQNEISDIIADKIKTTNKDLSQAVGSVSASVMSEIIQDQDYQIAKPVRKISGRGEGRDSAISI